MRSRTGYLTRALLCGIAAALLCGCQARLSIDIAVGPRGDGHVTVALTADQALLDRAREAGADPLDDLARAGQRLEPHGWRTTDETGGDGARRVALRVGFDDPDEFNTLMATLAEALDTPEVRLVEYLELRRDGLFVLDGLVGILPGPAVSEFGLEPAEAVALADEHDAFALEVMAALPGEVLDTTATHGTDPLRWEVRPGEQVGIRAVSEPASPRWWLAVPAVVALAVGTLVLLRFRRSRVRP
jgi:hypothetical protein